MIAPCPCGNGCSVEVAALLTYLSMDGSSKVVKSIEYKCGKAVAYEAQQEQQISRRDDAGRLARYAINERARAGAV